MAGFDTTDVAAKVNAQPFDAVKTMSGLADLNNAQNQNKLFQAKNLAGQYLAQSIGSDGQIDFNKFGQFIANDKRTGPYTPEIMTAAKDIQGTGVTTAANQQALDVARFNALRNVAAPAANTSQNPDPIARKQENAKNAVSAVAAAANSGMFNYDQDTISNYLGSGDFTRAATLAGAGGPGSLQAQNGDIQAVQTGGHTQMVNVNPALNTVNDASGDAATIKNEIPPAEVNRPAYQGFDANTQTPYAVTQGQAAAHPPRGPIATGPKLGDQAAAEASSIEGVKQYKAAQQDSVAAQGRILTLKKGIDAINSSNGVGPGTAYVNNIKSFFLAQGGDLSKYLPDVDATKIAARDEAEKYMTQYTLNRANSLGPLTGDKLAAAINGNANGHISTLAAKDMLKVNMALERMGVAGTAAFQSSGYPEQNYPTFMANWSRSVDPRAFAIDQMTQAERATMSKTFSSTEREQFKRGVQAAVAAKVYSTKDLHK